LIGGVAPACELLGRARASHYRDLNPPEPNAFVKPRPAPANKLPEEERLKILALLTSERFVDKAVAQTWAILLDEGVYLCSQSTMHRILREQGMNRERRRLATHKAKVKPELVASGPVEVWSWDITKLRGPSRGVYYQLYVIIDIYSRFVVGWRIEEHEDSKLAEDLIETAFAVHGIPGVVHADRGTSMTSKDVSLLLADLGVTRSHSRPRVSNDNPYSEAQFKTLKYAPVFPDNFKSIEEAREFCTQFFNHYNYEHRHSGIGLHTPASVHFGTANQIRVQRQATLDAAYNANPERFGNRRPIAPKIPTNAWINQPSREALIQSK